MGLSEQVKANRKSRPRVGEGFAPAVMRGHVVAVEGTRVYVALPGLSVLEIHGPVSLAVGVAPVVNDRVLVAAVLGSWNDLVVFAVL